MDLMLAAAAVIAVLTLALACYVVSRTTTHSSSFPKLKQSQAYTQKVTPKKRKYQTYLNSLDDFNPVGGMTTISDVAGFFSRRGNEFSVYSIDWEQEVLVLIRPVDGVDLKQHPFFREAQRRNAAEVLCIPFAQLQGVVSAIEDKVAHVQEVFIYITGRCGSTLLTRLVDATPVAQAACEPEVFSVISMAVLRVRRSCPSGQTPAPPSCSAVLSTEVDTAVLLRNVVTLLNYNLVTSDPRHRSVIFYKLKTDVILMADLMSRAFPAAKTVFMYRDGLESLESYLRVTFRQKYMVYAAVQLATRLGFSWIGSYLPDWPDYVRCLGDDDKFSLVRYRGSMVFIYVSIWAGAMQCAADLQKKQPEYFFHAFLNYAAFANEGDITFGALMRKLGLKWSPGDPGEDRQKMEKVFTEDSQAGTLMSSKTTSPGGKWFKDDSSRWCGHWEREYIREVCRHAGNDISGPDFIFPGSIL